MRGRGLSVLLSLALGCSTIQPRGEDAAPAENDPEIDAGGGGPDPTDDAGEAQLIQALSAPGFDDRDPTLTADQLEMYFASDRPGGPGRGDLYRSLRSSVDAPWGEPAAVGELNTGEVETAPEVSPDGLTLWFSSDRPGGQGELDIHVSRRMTRSEPWPAPVAIQGLNSPQTDLSPALDALRRAVVFCSTRDGGDEDLYLAIRLDATDPWDVPQLVTSLSSDGSEADPFLSPDGLTVYFSAGDPADLYRATRPDRDSAFGIPEPRPAINTEFGESGLWISDDGSYLVVTSDRSGDNEIYEIRPSAD